MAAPAKPPSASRLLPACAFALGLLLLAVPAARADVQNITWSNPILPGSPAFLSCGDSLAFLWSGAAHGLTEIATGALPVLPDCGIWC